MNKKNSLSLRLEFIWWGFTILLAVGVLYPIVTTIENYPFFIANIVFIIAFITLARYIFLLKHTFLARLQTLKTVLLFLSIPFIFYLINEINFFQTYLDEIGMRPLMEHLSFEKQKNMSNYIRNEMLFFGVGSIVSAIIFPFRMLISVWRVRNRGTV